MLSLSSRFHAQVPVCTPTRRALSNVQSQDVEICRITNCTRAAFPAHEFMEIPRWYLPLNFDGLAWKRNGFYLYHHHYLHSLWLLDTYTEEAMCLTRDIGREELMELIGSTRPRLDLFLRVLRGVQGEDGIKRLN